MDSTQAQVEVLTQLLKDNGVDKFIGNPGRLAQIIIEAGYRPGPAKVLSVTDIARFYYEYCGGLDWDTTKSPMKDSAKIFALKFCANFIPYDAEKLLELQDLLCCICQILDGPIDMPMSDWDKEQRLKLGQWIGMLDALRNNK